MISGWPRPAIAGSASCAPASASLRISGSGLISLFIGMKPETIVPGFTAIGNARAAIASAAPARMSAGSASRRASASVRSSAFREAGSDISNKVRSRDGRQSVIPGTYISRWAPYDRTHELGQGQLPLGS